jgi:signal transduction histidine kinase
MINEAIGQRLGSASWVADVEFDAILIASELVTNSIQAGSTQVVLTVRVHRSRVRLTVGDDGAGLPQIVYSGRDEPHGRGLALVGALAREWGVDLVPIGKEVWADVALPAAAFGTEPVAWCYEREVTRAYGT